MSPISRVDISYFFFVCFPDFIVTRLTVCFSVSVYNLHQRIPTHDYSKCVTGTDLGGSLAFRKVMQIDIQSFSNVKNFSLCARLF